MTTRHAQRLVVLFVVLLIVYLLFWPTGVQTVAWQPDKNPGYTGPFAPNERLAGMRLIPLPSGAGPEHVALGPDGWIYAALDNGDLIRLTVDGRQIARVANTGGRVLGFDFDHRGDLIAADAYQGLLRITPQGQVSLITRQVSSNDSVVFVDAVAVSPDGRIYFTEASQRFRPGPWGDPMAASLAEILEQKGNGRVMVHDPKAGTTEVVATGLVFANGILVADDGRSLLVAETGRYRVWRIPATARQLDVRVPGHGARILLDNLPGFPDNLTKGESGRYWLGLIKGRSTLSDALAPWPGIRNISFRLPHALLPVPRAYGHAVAFDDTGTVMRSLQDPDGRYPDVTGITEVDGTLYVHSLVSSALGVLDETAADHRSAAGAQRPRR